MNTKYIWLLAGLVLIGLGFLAYNFIPEAYVDWRLERANYCEVEEDCVNLGSKCPFGCYIYVNENEEKEMKNLLDSFDSKCVYGCGECLDVDCISGKCQPVCN